MAQLDTPSTSSNATYTTTVLLSNIHCPSCVRTIEDALHRFTNQILDVSTSMVTQTVTIKHTNGITASTIAKALYDAGFDVQSMWEQRGKQRISTIATTMLDQMNNTRSNRLTHAFLDFSCGMIQTPDQRRLHDATHSANCQQCAQERYSPREDSLARLTQPDEEPGTIANKLSTPGITVVAEQPVEARFRMVMGIGGMTCSACVGRVAEVLEAKPYVQEVNVNLISQSATLLITDNEKTAELVEEIEDIGYDATLESCEPVEDNKHSKSTVDSLTTRVLSIKVDGIHCQHCPEKIKTVLERLMKDIEIIKEPGMDGILTIEYTPRLPDFTIRSILKDIEDVDPAFKTSIYHPPSLEERARKLQARHWRSVLRRLVISICMAIPTFVLGVIMMSLLPMRNQTREYWMSPTVGQTPRVQWPLLAFATVVYFLAADLFHRRAVKEVYMMWRGSSRVPLLRRFYRFGSMDLLLSIGVSVAYIGSIAILIMSALQTEPATSADINTTTYFDAVVFLTMFLLMGRLLEAYGKAQTADAVMSLGKLRPTNALLLSASSSKSEDGASSTPQQIPVDQLEAGDIVLVPAGGSPPCDGIIHRGTTTMNESSLTGESKAVSKSVDDQVFAGTINITSAIEIRINGVAGVSLLDKIIDSVREGQAKRAPIERVADLLTGYFVPAIIAVALIDWFVWLSLGYAGKVPYVQVGTGGWLFWSLQFAIAVLVVACPCGIGLAAPTALFVGTGLAAKQGILVKGGGEAFQEASSLDCIVFDKTGTITEGGEPQITDSYYISNTEKTQLLGMIYSLETTSTHPLANAVAAFCKGEKSLPDTPMEDIKEVPGKGMMGRCAIAGQEKEIFIGNEAMAHDCKVFLDARSVQLFRSWSLEAKTVMLVGTRIDSSSPFKLELMLAAADVVRQEAVAVVSALRRGGVDVWLLSGDNETTAKVVAARVGIAADRVIAGVLPHEKAEKIQYLQRSARKRRKTLFLRQSETSQRASVGMVGDGINDAPALAAADVGIAMGSGSDTAISTASFVLLSSDLESVLTLLKLSKAVLRRVKFNFAWALGYNMVMLPIAAGVLFPVVSNGSHVRLDPVWASLAMALSSVSVVVSSLLLKTRLPLVGFRR